MMRDGEYRAEEAAWEILWEAARSGFLVLVTKVLPGEAEDTLCSCAGTQTLAQTRTAHHAHLVLPSADELNKRISAGGVSLVQKLQLRDASSQISLNCEGCVCAVLFFLLSTFLPWVAAVELKPLSDKMLQSQNYFPPQSFSNKDLCLGSFSGSVIAWGYCLCGGKRSRNFGARYFVVVAKFLIPCVH